MIRNLQKLKKDELIQLLKETEKSNEDLTDALDYYKERARAAASLSWLVCVTFIAFVVISVLARL